MNDHDGKQNKFTEHCRLLTSDDLAAMLGVTRRTLTYRIQKGESMPKCVHIGKAVRYRMKDIEDWLDSLQTEDATS